MSITLLLSGTASPGEGGSSPMGKDVGQCKAGGNGRVGERRCAGRGEGRSVRSLKRVSFPAWIL